MLKKLRKSDSDLRQRRLNGNDLPKKLRKRGSDLRLKRLSVNDLPKKQKTKDCV